jgi:hypothetical protein
MAARSLNIDQRLQWVVAVLLIAAAVAVVHLPDIRQNYSQLHWEDDLFFAHEQEEIHTWGDCLRKPVWPGLYRPLTTTCYYYLVRNIVGPNPVARVQVHHVLNVVFYSANGLVLFALGRLLLPWPWALVAAVIFVSRRAHVEIVLNTVEFQVLGATFFSFAALLLFCEARRQERPVLLGFSCLALALALLSKEATLVVPAILVTYGWLYDKRTAWRWYLAPLSVVVAWGVLFITFLRGFTGQVATGFGYTVAPEEVLANYSAYFLSKVNRLAGAPDSTIMPSMIANLADERLMGMTLALLFALGAGLLILHRIVAVGSTVWLRPFAFGVVFFGLATGPYAVLADRLFMRYSYFGHAGLALAAASVLWGCALILQAKTPEET